MSKKITKAQLVSKVQSLEATVSSLTAKNTKNNKYKKLYNDKTKELRVVKAEKVELNKKALGTELHLQAEIEYLKECLVPKPITTVYPLTLSIRNWLDNIKEVQGNKVYWLVYFIFMLVTFVVLMSSAYGLAVALSFGVGLLKQIIFHTVSLSFLVIYTYMFGIARSWWNPLKWKMKSNEIGEQKDNKSNDTQK